MKTWWLLVVPVVALAACRKAAPELEHGGPAASVASGIQSAPPAAAMYVGSSSCRDCHPAAFQAWQGSQHQQAMQAPSAVTVLGDFEHRDIAGRSEHTRFSHEGEHYGVEVTGVVHESGRAHIARRTFPVKYTFGVSPLQQYLLDSGDGHLQSAKIAWDSRAKEKGGGRWLELQPEEPTAPGDELHWSAPAYNWNTSCADCHSTDVRKRYAAKSASYATSFSEISVGCEACHGPGSEHAAQARAGKLDNTSGLLRDFARPNQRAWQFSPGKPIASLAPGSRASPELEACAFCHSHRADLGGDSLQLHDRYRVDLLDRELFHPDGQQRQETFEVQSFWQSKMFAAGVVCSDCHEPHSAKLRRPGNQLCTGCHDAQTFDTPRHHLHEAGDAASECVSCHMPTRTFMQIDARREHRFAVPRPDLTLTLGVPNPCTESCHAERGMKSPADAARWAAGVIAEHFGPKRPPSFAPALAAGRAAQATGQQELLTLALGTAPAIVRASALAELRSYPETSLASLSPLARDPSPLVRRALVQWCAERPLADRAAVVPLLTDTTRSVRIEAARALLDARSVLTSEAQTQRFTRALAELRASLEHNADRSGALLELARIELALAEAGSLERAEALFLRAMALEPSFAASYLNYADFLRTQQREPEAVATLEQGLEKCHDRAPLEHALGLAWVRRGERARGLRHLERAYRTAPDSVQLGYVYAIALHDAGKVPQAIQVLAALQRRAPADRAVAALLARYAPLEASP